MNLITLDELRLMSGAAPNDNMRSVESVVNQYGRRFGLDQLQRLAHFLAQLLHEGGNFRYDREVWGPTPAQVRYDTRTDLGNTPAVDGDGERNAGRGPIQVTGGDNIRTFTAWARRTFPELNPPDFFANPDLINTDPWEGLSAMWYWSTRKLNALADKNDIEQITKKINGGRNGLDDRIEKYERVGLVLLGFKPDQAMAFQEAAKAKGFYAGELDGDLGAQSRAAIHMWLSGMSANGAAIPTPAAVQAAPVVETKEVEVKEPVAVVAPGAEKRGIPYLLGGIPLLGGAFTWFFDLDRVAQIAIGSGTALFVGLLLLRGEIIIRRIKALRKEIET